MDSVISDNTSGGDGGGILTAATTLTVDSSVIRGNSSASTSGEGGGLFTIGTTSTITDTLIADNDVTDAGPGVATGGGLATGVIGSTTTLRGTTISGNKVIGGVNRFGGGVRAGFGTTVNLINSTVSGNEALGASADGAGINVDGGTTTIVHTTIGPNPVGAGGDSAIQRDGGTVNVRGSVIETVGAAPACGGGSITSLDDNVVTDTSCFAETGNDDTDADPMLGLLADNGGPDAGAPGLLEGVFTHLPAAASTVVDHVPSGDCLDVPMGALTIDQRGLLRPRDGNGNGIADCEAGSVELQPAVAPPPAGGGSTPTTTTPPTPAPVKKKKCKKKKGAAAAKKCKKKR